ncbi:uncharacterized protein LOC141610878 isoform X3 [Silene latifolia]|uniref:uncharacterized protein LOC141610878 isoform X3 n=1 Tax=Silene latifolia TaxID=37657 RepID=UPI003D775A37
MAKPTSRKFTHRNDESAFTRRIHRLHTTDVHLLRPPQTHSTSRPWIITRRNNRLYHPLTSKPHSFNFPRNFDFSQLHPVSLAVSYAFDDRNHVDKLLKLDNGRFFALYGGGQLIACPRYEPDEDDPWVKFYRFRNFDDITVFRGKIYAVDRKGMVYLIHCYKTTDKKFKIRENIMLTVTPGVDRFGWRKRFAIDEGILYLVVRAVAESFRVYMLKQKGKNRWEGYYWELVSGFEDKKVLFMGKDYYFFRRVSSLFPGKEFRNCIVFSEAAFPRYGKGCWEFTESDDRQLSEDDIAVFWFDDEVFAREGENSVFPMIDWSPPDWILNVSLEREPDEEEGLDSDSGDKNDGEEDSDSKDEEEQEEMDTDFGSQDQEDEKMQCDSSSQENKEEEMLSKENIEGDGSLQEDLVSSPHLVESVTRALLSRSQNDVVEQDTSGKNITPTTESHKSDSSTTKFEGLDIRSDLVQTLQKIWQKHGNIIKDSTVRSGDIVARALESLATIVRILEDNPAQSLSDGQADYLRSTLSDLKCIRFKVCWLVSFVEKVLLVHKSKPLLESLNNLSQLSSQVEERRTILLHEVAKLHLERNKLKEETAKVSKMIPFSGQVKFDEPIGAGFT